MQVWINGAAHELPVGARVSAVLDVLGLPGRGVAVAVDGDLVRRADWPVTPLADGVSLDCLASSLDLLGPELGGVALVCDVAGAAGRVPSECSECDCRSKVDGM